MKTYKLITAANIQAKDPEGAESELMTIDEDLARVKTFETKEEATAAFEKAKKDLVPAKKITYPAYLGYMTFSGVRLDEIDDEKDADGAWDEATETIDVCVSEVER